ncbi:MAG: sugar phosphate isomerase/epimerase [Clostridia bacterium]|nr:sugar phosphate isomerase/epimerase [Clostridia bacterium]
MNKIGLQMYTMRNHVSNAEEYKNTVARVADIGYKVLQMTRPEFMPLEENAAFLKSLGVSADSVFKPWDKVIPEIEDAKREAEAYGCDVLRTNSIPDEMRIKGADGYREFARLMNESGKVCRAAGLRYMYHFHAFEWISFGSERGIDILLNETDPEYVYFNPDVFWLTNAGTEPSVSLKMFRDRAFTMHVKDYAIRQLEGVIESVPYFFAPVGTGNLNWDGIMKTANEIGIRSFVVEQDMCDGDTFDSIRVSYENLSKMVL